MTTREIRIAIAEACGWKRIQVQETSFADSTKTISHDGWRSPTGFEFSGNRFLPNYPEDLNAMHEAEKVLSESKRCHFNAELSKSATGRNLSSVVKEPDWIWLALHATALHRAEAFLRAIGKWKD